jgi:hypothetical protein
MRTERAAGARTGRVAWWLVGALLGAFAVARLVGLAAERLPPLEFGAAALLEPDAALVAEIESHPTPVHATLYLSPPDALPTALRGLEDDLVRLFERLVRATQGRIGFALVHPESSARAAEHAAARGAAARRVRTVLRDGWSEVLVHASLELLGADGRSVLIEGLRRDDLATLQPRLAAHLALLARPDEARIGLVAPATGWRELERALDEQGRVERLALDAALAPGARHDLLVVVAPRAETLDAAAVAALEARRARGTNLLFAVGGGADALVPADAGGLAVDLGPRGAGSSVFWQGFGLVATSDVLLDPRCEQVPDASGAPRDLPLRVRAIAPNQDFRRFSGQPGGTLVFPSPETLTLDEARLFVRGWRAHVLATTSEGAYAASATSGRVPLERLDRGGARALGKRPLFVELEPDDALAGRVFVLAAAAALGDDLLARSDLAQRRALELVVEAATRDERLVAARGAYAAPATFAAPARADELLWRSFAVAAAPLVLLVLFSARRAAKPAARRARFDVRHAAWLVAALVLALLLVPAAAERLRREPDVPAALAQLVTRAVERAESPITLEFVLSPSHALPADLRAAARRARARLERLDARFDGFDLVRVDPSNLAPEALANLPVAERTHVRDEGGRSVARRVRAGLVVRGVGREPLIVELEDARACEMLEFRLALALHGAATGRVPKVDLAASTPRLSAAEAHLEYQVQQLFAPSGADVFSAARELLRASGFDVVTLDPDEPRPSPDADALVWLQPRRPTAPVLRHLVAHLRRGAGALVAGQPFEVVARQLEDEDLRLVHWPRPTGADLDALWFEGLGARVEPVVLLDRVVFADEADVDERRGERRTGSRRGAAATAYQVRASDLAWHGGASIALDEALLAQHGLAARVLLCASPRAWSHAWEGGYLADDVLAGPCASAPAAPEAPLVVELAGTFPDLDERLAALPGAGGEPGRLVLAASSEFLANGRLSDPRFGAPEFLVETVARLALPSELASLARLHERPARLGDASEDLRLAWRVAATGAAPIAALLAFALRALVRRRRS